MANSVYDEPGTKGQGTSSSGTGSSSSPDKSDGGSSFAHGDNLDPVRRGEDGLWKPHGDDAAANNPTDPRGNDVAANNPTDPRGEPSGSSQGDGLSKSGGDDNDSSGGTSSDKSNSTSRFRSRFKMSKRQAVIGTGAITGIAGLGIAGFLLLIPLKIEHVVKNLENRFMATSKTAVQSETDRMFKSYIINRVLPNLNGKCGSTIHKGCYARKSGATSNPVTKLLNTWSDARFENKLATNYGIELQRRPDGVYMKRSLKDPGTNIGNHGERIDGVFEQASGAEVHAAIKDETSWYNVLTRYKFGRLAEGKYGIKRCIIYCGASDPFHDKIDAQKKVAKVYLVQRVIIPNTQARGIALECILTGCDPTATNPNGDPGDPATHGADADEEVDKPVSEGLRKLALSYGIIDEVALKSLQDTVDKIGKDGIQKWLIKEGLAKVGVGPAVAALTADAIPIAGQINLAANIVHAANNAGPALKKLRYVVNGAGYVSAYMMYRTYADELHTGHVTPTELGSLTKSLGSDTESGSKSELGGTASAESTPLYRKLIDGESSPSTSSGTAKNYTCQNGKPVPAGKLICDEESLGGGNSFTNSIHEFLNTPPFNVLTTIANIWNATVGTVYKFFGDVVSSAVTIAAAPFNAYCSVTGGIPIIGGALQAASPYCTAKNLIAKALPYVVKGIMEFLLPNPLSSSQSGGRTFDAMAGGADVSGNAFAQNGIGGKALTPVQAATIVNTQESEAEKEFSQQPFFARMFNTDSDYSLITKVAMAIPFNFQSEFTTSFADLLSNPFGALTHSFGSIFSKRVFAVTDAGPDAFSVTQYGYTAADLDAIGDPETYWDAHCSDDATQGYQKDNAYNVSASGKNNADPDTGMPLNTSTNPCELIKATTGAAGGKMDTSNLEKDDLADVNGGSSSSSSTVSSAGLTNPFPGGWTPNRLDMGYDGTFKGQIVAPFSGTIIYASSSFSNWGGYIEIKADQQPSGIPSSTLYFAEGVKPVANAGNGKHVNAGDPIADPAPSPYGNAYSTDSGGNGEIEWGVAQDGPVGSPTNTYVYGHCGSSASTSTVTAFAQWAKDSLMVPGSPTTTSSAGCP